MRLRKIFEFVYLEYSIKILYQVRVPSKISEVLFDLLGSPIRSM